MREVGTTFFVLNELPFLILRCERSEPPQDEEVGTTFFILKCSPSSS
jgi:hypothetical protein